MPKRTFSSSVLFASTAVFLFVGVSLHIFLWFRFLGFLPRLRLFLSGRVVVLLSGRFAGKKGVVVKTFDDGTKERQFGHCLVAGVEREPLKVTKSMTRKRIMKRSKIKPFLKYMNYTHLQPTRYVVDLNVKVCIFWCVCIFLFITNWNSHCCCVLVFVLQDIVPVAALKEKDKKETAKKALKSTFEARFAQGFVFSAKEKFFFYIRFVFSIVVCPLLCVFPVCFV